MLPEKRAYSETDIEPERSIWQRYLSIRLTVN
jgi:hypothetical protein